MTVSIDTLTERDIAKMIDHSLLRPELDDAFIEAGCALARSTTWHPSAAGRPTSPGRLRSFAEPTFTSGERSGSRTANHATEVKVFEARRALADGATGAGHGAPDRRAQVRP